MAHIHRLPLELKVMVLSHLSTKEITQNVRRVDSQFRALVDNPGNSVLLYEPISDRERRRLRKEVSEVTSFPEGMDLLHAFRRFLARRGRWTKTECQDLTNCILAQRWTEARLCSRGAEWSEDAKLWHLRWIVFLLRVLLSLHLQVHHRGTRLWPGIPNFTDCQHFKQFLMAGEPLPPRWLLQCVPTTDANAATPQATLQLLTQWYVQIAYVRVNWLEGHKAPSSSLYPPRLAVSGISWISFDAFDETDAGHALRPDFLIRPPAAALRPILGVPDIPGFGPAEFQVEACYAVRTNWGCYILRNALRGQGAPLMRRHQSWILEQMYVF